MTPYYDRDGITIYHGDCLEVMKQFPDKSFDLCLTDPPYGINKAEWDMEFPAQVISSLFDYSDIVCVIPGIWGLGLCIAAMGNQYKWTLAGYKPAAMTNGPLGLNKWQPIVIGGKAHRCGCDAFQFHPTDGGLVGHPCQKPLGLIAWLVQALTSHNSTILDPFMGSGTTLVAAKKLGRRAVGIEISEKYCEIAVKRIEAIPPNLPFEEE